MGTCERKFVFYGTKWSGMLPRDLLLLRDRILVVRVLLIKSHSHSSSSGEWEGSPLFPSLSLSSSPCSSPPLRIKRLARFPSLGVLWPDRFALSFSFPFLVRETLYTSRYL